jgi:sigma54-dependent transcription regulator
MPAKIRCSWCSTRFVPKTRGRRPKFCSASCRQRAYEGRRLKVVRDRHEPSLYNLLKQDVAEVRLKTLVYKILVEAGVVSPTPPRP